MVTTVDYLHQRVGVFIDVQNLYYSARTMYDSHVNFVKIVEQATAKRQLIRAIAYVIKSDAPREQSFFDALGKSGLELKSKDIQIFPGGAKKGDWDVGLAVDAIKIADRLDVIVIVSGDGDYLPLVTYLIENKGCRVEAMAFGRSTSAKLIEVVDQFFDLDNHTREFLIKTNHHAEG